MKAIIMAGGKGSRLQPLTNDIPKPLVKIIDKPVMEHIINLLKRHGLTQIGVTLGFKADQIVDYFGDGSSLGVELTYFIEREPLGTAGSVKGAEKFLSDEFIVISGDCYTDADLSRAIAFHKIKNSKFTLIATPNSNPVGLGVLETDFDGKIIRFVEKPSVVKPALINCGIYIINKEVLSLIPDGFYDFGRQLIPRLVGDIYAFVTYDYWSDIGTLPSYYYTNYLVAAAME
jgi:Nucleoside-diphosphate-sugar pyrophosphorylase involved in lipopolysaccharide biosynthesis/translation initiation factor 2B, gamma/epsilon subunits (eIF-2Bgamma/eIF-2Bepsilon)